MFIHVYTMLYKMTTYYGRRFKTHEGYYKYICLLDQRLELTNTEMPQNQKHIFLKNMEAMKKN